MADSYYDDIIILYSDDGSYDLVYNDGSYDPIYSRRQVDDDGPMQKRGSRRETNKSSTF